MAYQELSNYDLPEYDLPNYELPDYAHAHELKSDFMRMSMYYSLYQLK